MNEVTVQNIQSVIITLPNRPSAMLASQIAELYEVETKRVNEAVKRNPERFPEDFVFQASEKEVDMIRSQNATKIYAGDDVRPWLFTRNGCNQLATVLRSDVAAQRSVQIMRAFSAIEEVAASGYHPMRDVMGSELYDKFFGNLPPNNIGNGGYAIPGISDAKLEMLVQKVVATARPLLQAQQASGQFIEISGVSNYLAWLPHELKKDSFTTKFDLYDLYSLYCSETNTSQDPAPHFFTKLYRCLPSLKSARILVGGRRTPVVIGISILLGNEAR